MRNGWIKYHRSIKDHWLYEPNRPRTHLEAWFELIASANFEDKKVLIGGQLIDCKRGQCIQSLDSWANQFNWKIGKVRHFFKLLEKDNMIIKEGLQYTTRLTICNYEDYQTPTTNEKQTENKPKANETQQLKNNKKEKKEKNKVFIPPTLEEVIKFFNEKGFTKEGAIKAYEYYEEGNWHDSKDNEVKNWKQKVRCNWFRDEYKINGKKMPHEGIQLKAI